MNTFAGDKGGICLDGTPGAFYYQPGTESTKWIFHFEGGGCECLGPLRLRASLLAVEVGQSIRLAGRRVGLDAPRLKRHLHTLVRHNR